MPGLTTTSDSALHSIHSSPHCSSAFMQDSPALIFGLPTCCWPHPPCCIPGKCLSRPSLTTSSPLSLLAPVCLLQQLFAVFLLWHYWVSLPVSSPVEFTVWEASALSPALCHSVLSCFLIMFLNPVSEWGCLFPHLLHRFAKRFFPASLSVGITDWRIYVWLPALH